MVPATETHWGMRPQRDKALMLARREVAVFVCDAVNLEGIPFTLPEVQTLLEGITVGGHKVSDQQVVLNQGKAWDHLFASLRERTFALSRDVACTLHGIAAKEEALAWGAFRSGGVTIAGTDWLPPKHTDLPHLFERMIEQAGLLEDIYDRAIFVFLEMARTQFFYDVNKRLGRLMMNGLLLDSGYPAINLPARRQLEFNQLMLDFYASGDQAAMNAFMRSCLDTRLIDILREPNA
ncbi:cell filamentation protein Fic [Halochromatium salexigens]|uniref:Cell filamentation protein Fic n=2 Tax=Halochromatium salexigens TaxID=49447 RepID=A0AAJ0XFF0_HALSE|nr:cell filamentation protein Fic [Halochromatium salexigens]